MTGSTDTQFQALNGLIEVYINRADWSQMRYYLDERMALMEGMDSPWQQLLTLRYLGIYYSATEALPEAQSAYRQALALARQLEQKSLEGELSNRLSAVTRAINADG